MKQKNADRVRQLLDENRELRKQLRAGEMRRRAAVNEIGFLNRRLSAVISDRAQILAIHRATIVSLAKKFGAQVGDETWEIAYPEADISCLECTSIQAVKRADGEILVRITPPEPDAHDEAD